MIEEDDRFIQKDKFDEEIEEKPNIKRYVILIIAWVIWTAGFIILFTPKIRTAIAESGVLLLLENDVENVEDIKTRTVKLSFLTQKGLQNFETSVKLGYESKYHDAIEGLLAGPTPEILKEKAITCINKNTSLLGLTYTRGICYVDLSKEFNSTDTNAVQQIEQTLLAFSEIQKVVILQEGFPISEKKV